MDCSWPVRVRHFDDWRLVRQDGDVRGRLSAGNVTMVWAPNRVLAAADFVLCTEVRPVLVVVCNGRLSKVKPLCTAGTGM